MESILKRSVDVAARAVLRPATVGAVVEHDGFRTIELRCARPARSVWVPGDKIRVRTGGLALRTYTPVSWDHDTGSTRVLAYLHADGPGSKWCRAAQPGDACLFLGPDRSVRLDRCATPPIFVGDETSLGLLLAWRGTRAEEPPVAHFEVTNEAGTRAVLHDHGADGVDVVTRAADDAHLARLEAMVLESVRAHPGAPLCLTGRAQTIAAIRRRLKAEGVTPAATVAKAYWDVRRTGLD